MDIHILENNKRMETQAGFTTGSMIEDNLFTLQYCIEGCYKFKKTPNSYTHRKLTSDLPLYYK